MLFPSTTLFRSPLDPVQLSVTVLLEVIGPGLVSDPGLGLVGVAGTLTPPGVWKKSTVVKAEHPALLQTSTFQRYWCPGLSAAVNDVPVVLVSTTSRPLPMSLTPTP